MKMLKFSSIKMITLSLIIPFGVAYASESPIDESGMQTAGIFGFDSAESDHGGGAAAIETTIEPAPESTAPEVTAHEEAADEPETHDAANGATEDAHASAEATTAAHEVPAAPADAHHKAATISAHPEVKAHKMAAHGHEIHWSYGGIGAPVYWGELRDEFSTCGEGSSQSPIDISFANVAPLADIQAKYLNSDLHVVNNGHAIQVDIDNGSSIVVDGKWYELLQFHFHSPSEHTIGGKAYPMVAHLVHKAADGQLGVIGVMITIGKANALIEKIWANIPAHAGEKFDSDDQINTSGILPRDMSYFNYSGSLTTPPCTEGVNWMVLTAPITISQEQLDQFQALYTGTARPVQPLNGRNIRLSN
ncbi:MAG: carbonic anhydrase family protein [Gammaproteobacteria bacterium]